MELELISFKICPFVQRSVITLRHKQVPFNITYIDLSAPPPWFHDISPFGKVPVLRVDGEHVIFESAVIDEFLDEITPGRLLPDDPLRRAMDRSWIEFGSAAILDLSGVMHADDAEKYQQSLRALRNKMDWVEQVLGEGPYFNGAELSLVDFSYAPLFMRTELLGLAHAAHPAEHCPKLTHWSAALLALPAVQNSVVPEFTSLLRDHIRRKAPYAASVLQL